MEDDDELEKAFWDTWDVLKDPSDSADPTAFLLNNACSDDGRMTFWAYDGLLDLTEENMRQARRIWCAQALRCLFGPLPFRPMVIPRRWLTESAVGVARTIYDQRRFEDMPILADALQDAGCDNADILNHCRQPGEHVRGCWVLDLLTGRS